MSRRRTGRRAPRGQRGFTLIELTVSLVAGLIVAMGVVALSKSSTQTFHEEIRSAAAEANLRTAVDRLRADLGRAGFMSTANIVVDSHVAKPLGTLNPAPAGWALARLASVHLTTGGSLANGLALEATNNLDPDAVELGGNMTTTDAYPATIVPSTGTVGGCVRVNLDPQSPAIYRLLGASAQPKLDLNNAFEPVTGQFAVRVVDRSMHTQYVATCPGQGMATGIDTGTAPLGQPYIMVDASTPILTASQAPTSIINGMAQVWVNPVALVRWELLSAEGEAAMFNLSPLSGLPLTPTVVDQTKYDLVRSYVDVNTGKVIAASTEIVAEYAVDLKLGFSVETGTTLLPSIVTYPFEDETDNGLWSGDVSTQPQPATTGPQRIRSIRVRIATRTAQADRTLNVPVPGQAGTYLYRYCVVAGCDPTNLPGLLQYARARTVVTEVSLPNQSTDYDL